MTTVFSRIIDTLGYKKLIGSPNLVMVIIPGLPYTCFDAHGYPKSWDVLNLLDSAQTCATHLTSANDIGSLLDMHRFIDGNMTITVVAKVNFYLPLYNKILQRTPLHTTSRMSYIGKTSMLIDTDMKADSSLIATFRQQKVVSSKVSRRPLPVPDWFKESFHHHGDQEQPMKFKVLEKPDRCHVTRLPIGPILFSDVSDGFHVNFSTYLKFSLDGVIQGSKSKCDDLAPVLVKSVFAWYRRECNLGDRLDVDYWRDDRDPTIVYVDMLNDGDSVFQAIIQFYDSQHPNSRL